MSSFIFLVFVIIVSSVLSSWASSSDSFLKWVREERRVMIAFGSEDTTFHWGRLDVFLYFNTRVSWFGLFFLDVYLSLTLHDIRVPLLPWSCYKHTCGLRGAAAATELALVSMFVEVRDEKQVQDTGQ
jgi:hypothetical protein